MNEQIQKALAAMITNFLDAAQKGVTWAAGQIPDVLHQLIVWKTATYCAWLIIGALLLVAAQKGFYRRMYVPARDNPNRRAYDDDYLWLWGPIIILYIGGTIISVCNAFNLLMITLAPKVWLLEYAASLIQGAK